MRLKSIITENDFVAYAPALTKVVEEVTIAATSYAWNDNLKAIHVNDSSAAVAGYFRLPIGFLKSGDIVTIAAEFKNVSGAKGKMALDYSPTSILGYGTGTLKQTSSVNDGTGGFETIELTFAVASDGYYSVPFGIITADIGEFYMRNCIVKYATSYNDGLKKFKRAFRTYSINGASGVYSVIAGYCKDTATLVVDSVGKKITLTHGKIFTQLVGIPFIQEGSGAISPLYNVVSGSMSETGCIIEIYDRATNTLQDPALISGSFWFSVLFAGYDNEIDLI